MNGYYIDEVKSNRDIVEITINAPGIVDGGKIHITLNSTHSKLLYLHFSGLGDKMIKTENIGGDFVMFDFVNKRNK